MTYEQHMINGLQALTAVCNEMIVVVQNTPEPGVQVAHVIPICQEIDALTTRVKSLMECYIAVKGTI